MPEELNALDKDIELDIESQLIIPAMALGWYYRPGNSSLGLSGLRPVKVRQQKQSQYLALTPGLGPLDLQIVCENPAFLDHRPEPSRT